MLYVVINNLNNCNELYWIVILESKGSHFCKTTWPAYDRYRLSNIVDTFLRCQSQILGNSK